MKYYKQTENRTLQILMEGLEEEAKKIPCGPYKDCLLSAGMFLCWTMCRKMQTILMRST